MTDKRTKGQTEDRISKGITKLYSSIVGVGPRESRAHILKDMIIVRLRGKLLPIEERLLEGNRGVELVKDIRRSVHESTTPAMNTLIKEITGHEVMSTHSDVSTKTGELLKVFILDVDFEEELAKSAPSGTA
jgi:uncharacterized protein YbcI